jgi:hypothetical protein
VQGFHDRRHYRIELLEFLKAHGSITANAAWLAPQKKPGVWIDPVRRAGKNLVWLGLLEHAEHDGADKGEGEIRGNNAQSAHQRAKGHFKPPRLASLSAIMQQANNGFPAKKVSVAVYPSHLGTARRPATWLKTREIKALMSP